MTVRRHEISFFTFSHKKSFFPKFLYVEGEREKEREKRRREGIALTENVYLMQPKKDSSLNIVCHVYIKKLAKRKAELKERPKERERITMIGESNVSGRFMFEHDNGIFQIDKMAVFSGLSVRR